MFAKKLSEVFKVLKIKEISLLFENDHRWGLKTNTKILHLKNKNS
jgi:hypothetical protein